LKAYNIIDRFRMTIKLLDKPDKLIIFINEQLAPKDIERRKFGEVFTPLGFINDHMLKGLETHYHAKHEGKNIWADPTLKFFDPAAGIGNFPVMIYYKLVEGLAIEMPDVEKRKKHIIENMLYMAEINKKNCYILKKIFGMGKYDVKLYCGDSLKLDINAKFGVDKFDVIIGNPPYSEEIKIGHGAAVPIYNKFIDYYIDKCRILTFIVPSRWFTGGKDLSDFRNRMLNRKDIAYINHYSSSMEIFGRDVNIAGGINYFLKDEAYNGPCKFNDVDMILDRYDVIVHPMFDTLINKLKDLPSITDIYVGDYFSIISNDKRLKDHKTATRVLCYVSQRKGLKKYIEKSKIVKPYNSYKVITPRATDYNGCFGNIIIAGLDEVYTITYIAFWVDTEPEAKSLESYLKCRLPNFMLTLRKLTQQISRESCKWIPLPPLNRIWTDAAVYAYFNLTADNIKMVNDAVIIGYDKMNKA